MLQCYRTRNNNSHGHSKWRWVTADMISYDFQPATHVNFSLYHPITYNNAMIPFKISQPRLTKISRWLQRCLCWLFEACQLHPLLPQGSIACLAATTEEPHIARDEFVLSFPIDQDGQVLEGTHLPSFGSVEILLVWIYLFIPLNFLSISFFGCTSLTSLNLFDILQTEHLCWLDVFSLDLLDIRLAGCGFSFLLHLELSVQKLKPCRFPLWSSGLWYLHCYRNVWTALDAEKRWTKWQFSLLDPVGSSDVRLRKPLDSMLKPSVGSRMIHKVPL